MIASDGEFLTSTVAAQSILMALGERFEVLVDMNTIENNNLMVNFDNDGKGILSSFGNN